MYVGNTVVAINRGQVYTSIRILANAWSWSVKKVRGFLNLLVSDGMIEKGTAKGTAQTLLTICNYDRYNFEKEEKGTAKGTRGAQQGHTEGTYNNKDNKLNNYNIPPYNPPAGDDCEISFDLFWNLYDKKVGSKEKLQKKWEKLPFEERLAIFAYLPKYKESQPDKKYRKNPETFLNNKSWNDELIFDSQTNGTHKQTDSAKRRELETDREFAEYAAKAFGASPTGD
jgi:hypothetical protein